MSGSGTVLAKYNEGKSDAKSLAQQRAIRKLRGQGQLGSYGELAKGVTLEMKTISDIQEQQQKLADGREQAKTEKNKRTINRKALLSGLVKNTMFEEALAAEIGSERAQDFVALHSEFIDDKTAKNPDNKKAFYFYSKVRRTVVPMLSPEYALLAHSPSRVVKDCMKMANIIMRAHATTTDPLVAIKLPILRDFAQALANLQIQDGRGNVFRNPGEDQKAYQKRVSELFANFRKKVAGWNETKYLNFAKTWSPIQRGLRLESAKVAPIRKPAIPASPTGLRPKNAQIAQDWMNQVLTLPSRKFDRVRPGIGKGAHLYPLPGYSIKREQD